MRLGNDHAGEDHSLAAHAGEYEALCSLQPSDGGLTVGVGQQDRYGNGIDGNGWAQLGAEGAAGTGDQDR